MSRIIEIDACITVMRDAYTYMQQHAAEFADGDLLWFTDVRAVAHVAYAVWPRPLSLQVINASTVAPLFTIPLSVTRLFRDAVAHFEAVVQHFAKQPFDITFGVELSTDDVGLQRAMGYVDARWDWVLLRWLPRETTGIAMYAKPMFAGADLKMPAYEMRRLPSGEYAGVDAVAVREKMRKLFTPQRRLVVVSHLSVADVMLSEVEADSCWELNEVGPRGVVTIESLGPDDRAHVMQVPGPPSELERCRIAIEDEYRHVACTWTPPDKRLTKERYGDFSFEWLPDAWLRRPYQHELVLSLALILADAPPYVLLEIVDWLPAMRYWPAHGKIALILAVQRQVRDLRAIRSAHDTNKL